MHYLAYLDKYIVNNCNISRPSGGHVVRERVYMFSGDNRTGSNLPMINETQQNIHRIHWLITDVLRCYTVDDWMTFHKTSHQNTTFYIKEGTLFFAIE